MALLDVTGGALLTRLYRSGGLSPLALGLMGLLAYRAYQKRDRIGDMFGGAMGGFSKIPAMLLARTDTESDKKPARKTRSRRRTTAKSASGSKRRTPARARSSRASQANGAATVH